MTILKTSKMDQSQLATAKLLSNLIVFKGNTQGTQVSTVKCQPGYVKNPRASFCYKHTLNEGDCDEDVIKFTTDDEVLGLIDLLKTQAINITPPATAIDSFKLGAKRNQYNDMAFDENFIINSFGAIKMVKDDKDENCVRAKWPGGDSQILEAYTTDCTEFQTFCQKFNEETVECVSGSQTRKREAPSKAPNHEDPFEKQNPLDLMINPQLINVFERAFHLRQNFILKSYAQIDLEKWYEGVFQTLWYNKNPCYDVNGKTSTFNGQFGLLKQCFWKGQEISCSAIFETFPTDRGFCCAFNMKKAQDIFKQSKYTSLINRNQNYDSDNAFGTSVKPKWYVEQKEPQPQPGLNKGLSVILDLHSDYISASSVGEDFRGFIGIQLKLALE